MDPGPWWIPGLEKQCVQWHPRMLPSGFMARQLPPRVTTRRNVITTEKALR